MLDQKNRNGSQTAERVGQKENSASHDSQHINSSPFAAPSISLPNGGGAIRGIGEKFAANPVTGTGSMTVPITATPSRSGFSPQLLLSYDSGSGEGSFGLGWNLSLPAITRKTDKGLPKYQDADESDVFVLSGSEDLVPVLIREGADWQPDVFERAVGIRSSNVLMVICASNRARAAPRQFGSAPSYKSSALHCICIL